MLVTRKFICGSAYTNKRKDYLPSIWMHKWSILNSLFLAGRVTMIQRTVESFHPQILSLLCWQWVDRKEGIQSNCHCYDYCQACIQNTLFTWCLLQCVDLGNISNISDYVPNGRFIIQLGLTLRCHCFINMS